MATTRKTTTNRRTPASRSTKAAATAAPTKARKAPAAKADQSLAARTGRTIAQKPYVSAAIATGAVTAVAAVAAGAYLLSRRDQSIGEAAGELGARLKDGLSDVKATASDLARKARARLDGAGAKNQEDYAAEALSLKETGETDDRPIDPLVADQFKAGAIAY